jgi:hypothetical protein
MFLAKQGASLNVQLLCCKTRWSHSQHLYAGGGAGRLDVR